MDNRRAVERTEMRLAARIILDQVRPVPCIVRDRSEFGARLTVASVMGIPDEFDLQIPSTGELLRASVAWREAGSLGVMVE